MKQFFKKLMDSGDPTSSKRFVGLLGSISLIVVMCVERNEFSVNAVLILCLGCFAINGAEKVTSIINK